MADTTAISWTDATFNPWTGCTKVSKGCDGCYAEAWSKRAGPKVGKWGPGMPRVRTTPANWRKPLVWNATAFHACEECGWRGDSPSTEGRTFTNGLPSCPVCDSMRLMPARRRVFCASLADVFDNEVDPLWRAELFELIGATPNLDWLLLTKRIGNAHAMMNAAVEHLACGLNDWDDAPWPHVWLGATIVNQEEADRDIPKLLATPARVRFLSMEPLLGPVNLRSIDISGDEEVLPLGASWLGREEYGPRLDWVIAGGESGTGARPMHPGAARALRDQCTAAGVPFHFKQWGEWLPWSQFSDSGVEDTPEQTRFQTAEWKGEAWVDVGRPLWCDSADGVIDDMQCVGRVGKKAAGRLLDGREWNGVPS